jgi:hypothetical protein
MWRKLIV